MPRYDFQPPSDAELGSTDQLARYVAAELRKISSVFQLIDEGRHDVMGREPAKPRVGQVIYADGVGWNPGYGAGVYVYSGTAWVPVTPVGSLTDTPVLSGLTTAGTGTVVGTPITRYTVQGKVCNFEIQYSWSAHTGTGQLSLSLPVPCAATPAFRAAAVTESNIVPALAVGDKLVGLIFSNTNRCDIYYTNAGGLGGVNFPRTGTLRVTGSYFIG